MKVCPPKRTKVLLIVFAVCLVFALGGLCILGTLCEYTSNTQYTQTFTCDVNLAVQKLYLFSVRRLTWSDSHAFCVSKGASLVTITSRTEQRILLSKIKEWHWIGLNDLETEGHWVWVNNQTLSETGVQFWYKRKSKKSEPDNSKKVNPKGQNCAVMKNFVYRLDSWFDVSCKNQRRFISTASGGKCSQYRDKNTLANFESLNKKHVMVSMQLSAQEKNGTAMKKEFNDLTARYNSLKERLSFFKAQSCNLSVDGWIACRGKLYLFSSDKLNWSRSREDVLVSKIKQTHWIGLNDLETEGRWVWVNNQTLTETKVQFWFSEKQREPDNWSKQDPSGENCASLGDDNGNFQSWFDASCKKKKKFICEKKYRFTPISDSN
ncbi:C-type lectin domain family 4 member F [Labeo rohita]|uniref:C-type lectin domain family 4 member F n=1 Tax=Labeo rohita TaxID=84645 RepID=A0ABQ8LR40_LABRO|nr:C-type lectin domain family 4 member F [Labeo rohita]